MVIIWSPAELAQADAICRRLAGLLRPESRRFLEEARTRFCDQRTEHEARGAWFELRMLDRLADADLREAELERPVAPGATGCSVDLFLSGKGIGVEFMAAQHVIVPTVQVSVASSKEYLEEEFGTGARHSGFSTEDQAAWLFRAVNRKCGDKDFALLGLPAWLMVNTNDTDFTEQYQAGMTRREHFQRLGDAFRRLAAVEGTEEEPNHLLASPRVSVGFVNSFHGTAPEHLIVFGRSVADRGGASALAAAFRLVELVA